MKQMFKKRSIVKAIAMIICVVMIMGIAPFDGVLSFAKNVSATVAVEYNPEYGKYTYDSATGTLTAIPYENCGFRAWYYNGEEVSIEPTYTVTEGDYEDYIPEFYNFNLVSGGTFEGYGAGTNMRLGDIPEEEKWFFNSGAESWGTAVVSTDYAKTAGAGETKASAGTNSLRISSRYNTAYRYFTGLETNKKYTLKFYYRFHSNAIVNGSTALRCASVTTGYAAGIDGNAGYGTEYVIASVDHSQKTYTDGEWTEVSITFNTGNNTEVALCLSYIAPDSVSNYAFLYLDDLSLVKSELKSVGFSKIDFDDQDCSQWSKIGSGITYETEAWDDDADNYRLKVTNISAYEKVQSPCFEIINGCTYTLSFRLDLGTTAPSINDQVTWSLSNTKGQATTSSGVEYYLFMGEDYYDSNFTCHMWDYDKYLDTSAVGRDMFVTEQPGLDDTSRVGFSIAECTTCFETPIDYNNVYVVMSFTATETTIGYFNIWGSTSNATFYIDDLEIAEETPDDNTAIIEEQVAKYALECVGTAIRLSGDQGLRYKTKIDKRLLCSEKYFGIRAVEYGTVAIRSNYLDDGEELVLDTEYIDSVTGELCSSKSGYAYLLNEDTVNNRSKMDVRYDETATSIVYTGVLINIDEKYYNTDFAFRSYVKFIDDEGVEKTVYSDVFNTSVYSVSKLAYTAKNADGTFAESSATRQYLYNNILMNSNGSARYIDKTVNVKNASEVINDNFQGISSTFYNAFTFIQDPLGRSYTDEAAEEEVRRLADSGINNVRTTFQDEWCWDATNNCWNWETDEMQAVYKWANLLNNYDITITLNPYSLYEFVNYYEEGVHKGDGNSNLCEYLHGEGDCVSLLGLTGSAAALKEQELVSELVDDITNATLDITSQDETYYFERLFDDYTDSDREAAIEHYAKAAIRFGEWIRAAAEAIEANSENEVEYIAVFTESGDPDLTDPNYTYDEWIVMAAGLNNVLKEAGVRDDYKTIGPNQSLQYMRVTANLDMVSYTLNFAANNSEYAEFVDIYSAHQYTNPNEGYPEDGGDKDNSIYEAYASYNFAKNNFELYKSIVGDNDIEFWCDEYFAYAKDARWIHGNGMQMTQFAAGLTAAMNNGVDRVLSWAVQEQVWVPGTTQGQDNYSGFNGEFVSGVLSTGTASSLASGHFGAYARYATIAPRVTYYGINLLGKYLQNKSGEIYTTQVVNGVDTTDGGLYTSSVMGDDGKMVILVVNTTAQGTAVNVSVENQVSDKFIRYTYNPEGITPTEEAASIPRDGTVTATNGTFYDVVPPQSFCLYIARTSIQDNDDVDVDTDIFFDSEEN